MNTLRKIRKNAKALSPVVASIILIAVTVAVSIAVAAWMGGLSVGFMQTEQLTITSAQASAGSTATIVLIANNTGTTGLTINQVWVNNGQLLSTNIAFDPVTGSVTVNSGIEIVLDYVVVAGGNYQIKLVTAKGNSFTYTVTAPT
jgi:flagellin-like protein